MLGISVYPYKENIEETINYIKLANKYNFKRLFTNLLFVEDADKDKVIEANKKVISVARNLGMEVIIDVNPQVFKQLNLNNFDLTFFKEMGVTGIRLDTTFDGMIESIMSFSSNDLDLEINLSNDTKYYENLLSFESNKKRIIGCHNFYPQKYTGLSWKHFLKCSKKYKKLGMRTAAFISSQTADHGPHVFDEGLCTVEMHRDLPIVLQAKHLIATGVIDDVIIANAYASEKELEELSKLNLDQIQLDVVFSKNTTEVEKKIILENQQINRGDISEYMIRSSLWKFKYVKDDLPVNNANNKLVYGDITVGNNDFGQYKAEVNIVTKEMENNTKNKNIVGKIPEEEYILLDLIKPWTKFLFRERKN